MNFETGPSLMTSWWRYLIVLPVSVFGQFSLIFLSVSWTNDRFVESVGRKKTVNLELGKMWKKWSLLMLRCNCGNFSSFRHCVQTGSVAHAASHPVGTGGSFLGVKRSGREADHQPRSRAEVKNEWSYTSTPKNVLMQWCLVKEWIRPHSVVIS